jgi:hypothetical protein
MAPRYKRILKIITTREPTHPKTFGGSALHPTLQLEYLLNVPVEVQSILCTAALAPVYRPMRTEEKVISWLENL